MKFECQAVPKIDESEDFFPSCPYAPIRTRDLENWQSAGSQVELEANLQRAQDKLAWSEPNLRRVMQLALEKSEDLQNQIAEESSSDLGAESLHIWHLEHQALEDQMHVYGAVYQDAKQKLLRLEDDVQAAEDLLQPAEYPNRSCSFRSETASSRNSHEDNEGS